MHDIWDILFLCGYTFCLCVNFFDNIPNNKKKQDAGDTHDADDTNQKNGNNNMNGGSQQNRKAIEENYLQFRGHLFFAHYFLLQIGWYVLYIKICVAITCV